MEISRLMLIRNHWIWTSKHKAFNSINSFFWLIDWVVICCLIWSWYDWETDIWWGIFESWDWVFWSRNSLKSQLLKLTTRTNSSISGKQMTWQLYQSSPVKYSWKHDSKCFIYFRIPTSSPLGDPGMASTAALLGLHSRPDLPPNHPLSPTYLALHSSPTSSLR